MDKLKKFVILPISLLVIELILKRNYSSLDYWKYLFISGANVPWQHILLGILAILLYILGIVALFLWMFTDTSPKTLLNQSTAKVTGISFAIYYLAVVVVIPVIIDSVLMRCYSVMISQVPWLCIIIQAIFDALEKFFLIYLILWLFLKPVGFKFTFRKKPFILAIMLCLIINALYNYVDYQIVQIGFSNFAGQSEVHSIDFLNLLTDSYKYHEFVNILNAIVYAIQDVIILVFINSCIKCKKSVEIPNV